MTNIIIDALKSKLDSLKSQQVDLNNQVKEYDTQVINSWKQRYIDNVPFISNSAKEKLVITRENSGFNFTCTEGRWGSGISVCRNANWRNDDIRPEISWFSSRTDKNNENNYLDILQILGLIAGYIQADNNAFSDLMATYDACIKNAKEINGDISSQIWEVERGIRDAESKQKENAKLDILHKGKIELPHDIEWGAMFYTSADNYSNRRFTHMKWEENKGGKTYKVSGYILKMKEDGTFEQRNAWYVERVKKDRLLDGISNAIAKLEDYNEEKATKEVVA